MESLVKILANKIKYIFGVSGGGLSLSLITELEKRGVKFYPVAHEAAGAIMAGAASGSGETKAAAISIKGPGLANMVPGILLNHYEYRPAITISESYSKDSPFEKMHKRLNHKEVIQVLVKANIDSSNESNINEAIALAETEIPGPIHIELAPQENIFIKKENYNFSAEEEINTILDSIKNTKRPALVLGSVAKRQLKDINWQELKIPVFTTASAKGAINEESDFSAGIITGEIKDLSPEKILVNADLIIAIGLRNTEVVVPHKFDSPLIIFDSVSGRIHRGFNAKEKIMTPDLKNTAEKLLQRLKQKEWGKNLIKNLRDKLDKELLSDFWMPANIFRALNDEKRNNNLTLVLDTGIFCTVGEIVFKAEIPEEFIGSSNGRFMGTAIPTAIGFSIANPDRNVICTAGDGGIRPYFPEIKLAVEENLPIFFILMADSAYGTFSDKAKANNLSERAYKIRNSSWVRAAEAIGCSAHKVKNLEQFINAFEEFSKVKKPMFIEMDFNADKYSLMADNLR